MSIRIARATLPEVITRAEAGTVTVITRHGKAAAAVVPLYMLKAIEDFEDEALGRLAEEALAEANGETVPLSTVLMDVFDR